MSQCERIALEIFFASATRPNNTKSLQLSTPQIAPAKTTNKISDKGYNFVLSTRGSSMPPK